jgi:tetratricopeptide (TPR) repeat protein
MKQFLLFCTLIGLYSCGNSEKKASTFTAPAYETISLLGDTLYAPTPSEKLQARYTEKKKAFETNPDSIENHIWLGRFTAYKGNYNEAIHIYTEGLQKFPNDARLYRHRGHRYITLRKFDEAIADLSKAAQLIEGQPNQIEPDGMPNERNIPVSTLHGNIYYHLGLAHYLNRAMGPALDAFKKCLETSNNPDNVVSATHWIYMINRRLGREGAANNYVKHVKSNLDVIENGSYYTACLFYKGELTLEDIQTQTGEGSPSDTALKYAIANWFYYTGYAEQAKVIYQEIVAQDDWASFGYIAAENDLAKLY